jgi:hypothetical protein
MKPSKKNIESASIVIICIIGASLLTLIGIVIEACK